MYSSLTMPGRMWTKMGSKNDWQREAKEYYEDGLKITHIEALLDVSRKSISVYLHSLPEYEQIREKRRKEAARQRRAYQTKKQRQYRNTGSALSSVTPETIRREHELAVMELSRERYH